MLLTGIILTAFCLGAEGELLANGGFERTNGALPAQWHLFVLPQPGAVGRIETDAHAGAHAAMLHTPLPYERDPINNWSQNVHADVAGKTLILRGAIRTQEATEAAIWVQCWKQGARLPHAVFSTRDTVPFQGTRDWEEVSQTIKVPAATDFLVVRCVLLGTGSAWFDEISLAPKAAALPAPAADNEDSDANAETQDTKAETPPKPTNEGVKQDEIDAMRKEFAQLREANLALAEALDALRETNSTLLEQMRRLKADLSARAEPDAAEMAAPDSAPPRFGPHGILWEDF
mgnify:CR=1 FL=1